MTILVKPEEMPTRRGKGWSETVRVDGRVLRDRVLAARLYTQEPNARGPVLEHGRAEGCLYVKGGGGSLVAGEGRLPLGPESFVWLEPGERFQLEAGPEGLEVVYSAAPGYALGVERPAEGIP